MQIQKFWFTSKLGEDKADVEKDGKYYRFQISPFRVLTEKDLTLVPFFDEPTNYPKNKIDVHLLRFYGLELL